ncbi:hypothetical protein IEQ34_020094 [Dendrobium chrysotoxum]|uniref:BZIP domain-containing protein n=1 Tax=Dendrobium chrysotoxum TaxID=161865 RepID=A0AAV7G1I5_DENCH|nr:hypothetical protein IEQ34_020094 [Dendrobium chrysotoxum]
MTGHLEAKARGGYCKQRLNTGRQECDELARKVAELNSQNSALRMELEQLHKVCRDLEAENQHIVEGLNSIREESSSTLKQGVGDHIDNIPLSSTTASTKMNGKLYHPVGNPDPTSSFLT